MRWFLMVMALFASTAAAADWTVPQRGTAERKAMMDALRPHAEWLFGAPVELVVHDLRRAGNVGYGALKAQRPGGEAINIFCRVRKSCWDEFPTLNLKSSLPLLASRSYIRSIDKTVQK